MRYSNEINVLLVSITLVLAEVHENEYQSLVTYAPRRGWVGYPCGLVDVGKVYRLLYEYSPNSTHRVNVSWGHATSLDFIQFEDKGVALPYNATSKEQRYSGSTVYDRNNTSGFGTAKNGPVVAIYTSFYAEKSTFPDGKPVAKGTQCQSIAYSLDNLQTPFQTYGGNCVIRSPPPQYASEFQHFRDPKVIWYAPQKKWVMVVALPRRRRALFYSSRNLKKWTFMSEFSSPSITSDDLVQWEKPDLVLMSVLNRTEKKWLFAVSKMTSGSDAYQDATYYLVGDFDGAKFVPDNRTAPFARFNSGSGFYAGVAWTIEGSTQIELTGWVDNPAYASNISANWTGAVSASELVLRKVDNGYMLIQESADYSRYVKISRPITKAQLEAGMPVNNSNVQDCVVNLLFTGVDKANVSLALVHPNNVTEYEVQYDHKTKTLHSIAGNFLYKDRRGRRSIKFDAGNELRMVLLINKRVIQLNANDGAVELTEIIFHPFFGPLDPLNPAEGSVIRTLKLAKGSTATVQASIQYVQQNFAIVQS